MGRTSLWVERSLPLGGASAAHPRGCRLMTEGASPGTPREELWPRGSLRMSGALVVYYLSNEVGRLERLLETSQPKLGCERKKV